MLLTISRQEVLTFHISGSTKHKKVLKTGKGQYFNASDVNISWASKLLPCCFNQDTRHVMCDFITRSLEFLSLVLDGVSIQHNVIQLELRRRVRV